MPRPQAETLVLAALDPARTGEVAGTLDTASGLLTPARRTWRTRPVAVDATALVVLVTDGRRTDLRVERRGGWSRVLVPLVHVGRDRSGRDHEATQPVTVLRALTAELARRGPREVGRVLPELTAHVRWTAEGRPPRDSPLLRVEKGSWTDLFSWF